MGDVTSTCCQNTTHQQQVNLTRQINLQQQPLQQVLVYEPFQQAPEAIKQTIQQAAGFRFFKQHMQGISLEKNSQVWNQDNIITVSRKSRGSQSSRSIFDIVGGAEGKFCTYIKSLRSDNIISEPSSQRSLQTHPQQKTFTGLFLISFPSKQYFLGHLLKNRPTNGIFVFKPGCYFVGNINQLTAQGQGRYQNKQNGYIYEGFWSKNLQHGRGKEFYEKNGDVFDGQFMYGSKFGEGVYKFGDGKVYEGYFYNGHSDGEGRMQVNSKEWYKGEWRLGCMQGLGEYHYPNGDVYRGEFQNGLKSGRGRYVFAAGYEYDGEWLEGKMHGTGVIKEGYDQIQGQWIQGKKVA